MDFDGFLASKYPALFLVIINAIVYLLDYKIKNYCGLILVFFGAFAYFYNLIIMGKFWSIKVEKKSGLVSGGFFRYIRHPLYLGCALACFGAVIMSYNLCLALLFVLIDLPFIYLRSKYEEKILLKSLKNYRKYMKKTWMFIHKII